MPTTPNLTFKETILVLSLALVTNSADALSLSEYLDAVKSESPAFKAAEESAAGAQLQAREADLAFSPKFLAEGQVGHDAKETTPKTSDKIKSQAYSLGISQEFSFGLKGKLSYGTNQTEFVNANPLFIPNSSFWDTTPKLELSLPVWGGGFGASARAAAELTRQQNYATRFGSDADRLALLAQAETAYWKLSAWNDVVRIQEEALSAAKNILSYVSRKQKMNLGEDSDVVQARALVEARTLELQVAHNEKREALRMANRYLHRGAEQELEALQPVNYAELENLILPSAPIADRPDVRGAVAQVNAAKAAAVLAEERNRPTLEFYGSYALNGRAKEYDDALSRAGFTQHDSRYVGMRLSVPLNWAALSDAKAGALRSLRAAEFNRESARYNQEQDWTNLTISLSDLRENLKLLGRIESTQKAKLEVERARLRQGRTTTYQVLLFEQDYSQAALSRAKSAAGILALKTQIQFYQGY